MQKRQDMKDLEAFTSVRKQTSSNLGKTGKSDTVPIRGTNSPVGGHSTGDSPKKSGFSDGR